jgi:hypothetical protein
VQPLNSHAAASSDVPRRVVSDQRGDAKTLDFRWSVERQQQVDAVLPTQRRAKAVISGENGVVGTFGRRP